MTIHDFAKAASVPADKAQKEDPKIRQVSNNFESLFVNQLVSEMRKTVDKQGFIPESQAERVYQSMLDSEYSQRIADTGQLGLSNLVYNQLMRSR